MRLPLVRRMVEQGPQLLGPIFHVLDDGQPAEAVGDVGGILFPESMVAGPQSLDRMGYGESCIRRIDQGLKFRGKCSMSLEFHGKPFFYCNYRMRETQT